MSRDKRPAFQFYPGDWLRDTALRSVSIAARGLWMDLICLMHDGQPYGHLAVNNRAIPEDRLAGMVGLTVEAFRPLLVELIEAGIPSVTEDGVLHSRRMVKDERIRSVRSKAGKSGAAVVHGKQQLTPLATAKQPAKVWQTVAAASADAVAKKEEAKEGVPFLSRCVVALNAGLAANPHLGRSYRPVSTSEQSGRVTWEADGIPVETAERVIIEVASRYTPTERSRQPNSLRYFDAAVREAHERQSQPAAVIRGANPFDAVLAKLDQEEAARASG